MIDVIVHIFNEGMTVLNWLAVHVPWGAVLASGLLSGLLIGPQKLVKRWFKRNEQVIITIIGIVGPTSVAAWTYLLHQYGTDPNVVVLQGLAVSFMTQPFYFMFWKPYVIGKLIPKVAKWIALQVTEAEKLNTENEPAPIPADTPKLTVPIQDFKP